MDLRTAYIESLENCIKAAEQQPAFHKAGAVVIPLAFAETLIEHFKNGLSNADDLTDQSRAWLDILHNR